MTLSATTSPDARSRARYTWPIPPKPARCSIVKRAKRSAMTSGPRGILSMLYKHSLVGLGRARFRRPHQNEYAVEAQEGRFPYIPGERPQTLVESEHSPRR